MTNAESTSAPSRRDGQRDEDRACAILVRVVAACQIVTVLLTWNLWQERTAPPLLPLFSGPACDTGPLMLFSLILALLKPTWGVPLHTAVASFAVALDQTRLQPQVVSQIVLMWGAIGPASWRMVARASLVATWFYAGFWKLISPDFYDGPAAIVLRAVWPAASASHIRWFGGAMFSIELLLAALVVSPWTRKFGAWLAMVTHLVILMILSPLGANFNSAIWPWNVSLAAAAIVYFWFWTENPVRAIRAVSRPVQTFVAFALLAPATHFFGLCDAYLAHSLYSGHHAYGVIESPDGTETSPVLETLDRLNVPLPPEPRLYRAWFRRTSRPGERLVIRDPRWWYTSRNASQTILNHDDDPSK